MPRGKKKTAVATPVEGASSDLKLARRLADGTIEARKRGRQPAGAVIGYMDASGAFVEGEIPKAGKRKGGRRKGSKNTRKLGRPAGKRLGRPLGRPKGSGARIGAGGLSEIERIVQAEVSRRMSAARDAAISAISAALG
jgi:hypothetical protein